MLVVSPLKMLFSPAAVTVFVTVSACATPGMANTASAVTTTRASVRGPLSRADLLVQDSDLSGAIVLLCAVIIFETFCVWNWCPARRDSAQERRRVRERAPS